MERLSTLVTPDSADEGAHSVARLVYASVASIRDSVYAEMERIRASALKHNEPVGVHTALLYQSGWFLQWKEGPGHALLKIMDRVANDRRHHALRIVHASRGARLLDGPWSMAIVQCDDPPLEMAQRVEDVRRRMDQGEQYSPTAVWRQLSTPVRHPGAQRQADPDAFQRVLVCASAGMGSFDVVRALAAEHGEEVVHRRFAGAQDLDVGTDYVDFEEGDRVLRVIAMARKGLMVPLTRAFLCDYSHIILLLDGDAERSQWMVQRVVQACAHLPAPPPLLGVALEPGTHRAAFEIAHRSGQVYLEAVANPDDPLATWAAVSPQLALWRDAANSGSSLAPVRRASA
nr:BLUF domain-containing protein [Ramlibacter albus]